MTIKTILPLWWGMAFLCLLSARLHAQTQAEASETYLYLQQGQKERFVEPGDHIKLRTENHSHRIKGPLYFVTDSTLIVKGVEVPISSITSMSVQKRPLRLLATWLAALSILGPMTFGLLLQLAISILPTYNLWNRDGFWKTFTQANRITSWIALIGSTTAALFARKKFRMKEWKIQVKKRRLG